MKTRNLLEKKWSYFIMIQIMKDDKMRLQTDQEFK